MVHFPDSFSLFSHLYNSWLLIKSGVELRILWCRKRLVYQLCRNHFPQMFVLDLLLLWYLSHINRSFHPQRKTEFPGNFNQRVLHRRIKFNSILSFRFIWTGQEVHWQFSLWRICVMVLWICLCIILLGSSVVGSRRWTSGSAQSSNKFGLFPCMCIVKP